MATLSSSFVKKGQGRIVSLPIAPSPKKGSVVMGLSGVLADNVALISHVKQDVLISHTRMYGLHTLHYHSPSSSSSSSGEEETEASYATVVAKKMAVSIANKCQSHSFGGGLRPFGCQMIVCGVDEVKGCVLGVVDSSGSVSFYGGDDGVTKKGEVVAVVVDPIMIGGSRTVQLRIMQNVRAHLMNLLQQPLEEEKSGGDYEKIMIRKGIESIVATLSQEYDVLHSEEEEEEGTKSKHPVMEIAIVTPRNGVYKLNDDMIEQIWKRIQKKIK